MKENAISIKQPWTYLICAGIKDVENRTWATKYRGRVYIHASMAKIDYSFPFDYLNDEQKLSITDRKFDDTGDMEELNSWLLYHRGAIIGHVDIVDCVINHDSIWAEKSETGQFDILGDWTKPTYNWVLANPVLFDKPILNVKGKLSFWDCSEYLIQQ